MRLLDHKIPVSVLGATGMVGQHFLRLLENHPWFQVVDVAASKSSAGKKYKDSVHGKWVINSPIPMSVRDRMVRNVHEFDKIPSEVKCVFSAMDLPEKQDTRDFEFQYASKGYGVISTSSANRQTKDVPMIIPEINPDHADIIPIQQKNRSLPATGFVAVKPNCSIQSYVIVLEALKKAGYPVNRVQVITLQALSGAGTRGLYSPELKQNVVPFIPGEEEKTENEPLKIFGEIIGNYIEPADGLEIDAVCTRVPVIDGHTAVVHLGLKESKPTIEEVKTILSSFQGAPQKLKLPSAPSSPIMVNEEETRPQPRLDKDSENGMAVTVGRISKDRFFDIRLIGLSHNTIRGAAGGAILTAELLVEKGYIS